MKQTTNANERAALWLMINQIARLLLTITLVLLAVLYPQSWRPITLVCMPLLLLWGVALRIFK